MRLPWLALLRSFTIPIDGDIARFYTVLYGFSLMVGPVETNKSTALLVFALVFGVAPNVTYSNTLPLARLEDQHKTGAILAGLFVFTGLNSQ